MEVDVDGAGQQQLAGGVDGLGSVDAVRVGGEEGDFASADADVERGDAGFEYDLGVYDQGVKLHGFVLLC